MSAPRCTPCCFAALLLGALGCGGSTVLRTGGPYPEEKAPNEGVRYYAPREVSLPGAAPDSAQEQVLFWRPPAKAEPVALDLAEIFRGLD